MQRSLADKIRDGYHQAMFVADAGGAHVGGLRRRLRDPALSYSERDALLAATIRCYRTEDVRIWGPVLLELLAPAIMARLERYSPVPPAIDEDDVAQQFLVEVLVAAATMPLPADARYVERRLMKRAAFLTSRWLRREDARQADQAPLEDDPDEEPSDDV
jgi:hypothetical protein